MELLTVAELKVCTRCKQGKTLDSFYPDKRTRSGLTSECKACQAATRRVLNPKYRKHVPEELAPLRACKTCGKEQPLAQYHRNKTYRDGYDATCRNCRVNQAWAQRSKQYNRVALQALRRKRKADAVALLGGKCVVCGYSKSLAALDFHHTDPTTKDFNIKQLFRGRWDRVLAELPKCVLLCANCHRELHEEGESGDINHVG